MTSLDRRSQLADEAHQLREVAHRLIAGKPQRSNGKLTVAGLAVEAGLPRHRLYGSHIEVVVQFKTATGGGPSHRMFKRCNNNLPMHFTGRVP